MNLNRLKYLFQKYVTDTLKKDEAQEFRKYLENLSEEEYNSWVDEFVKLKDNNNFNKEQILENVFSVDAVSSVPNRNNIIPFFKIFVAAAVLMLVGLFAYYFSTYKNNPVVESTMMAKHEVHEVDTNSSIVLADGKSLDLVSDLKDTLNYKGLSLAKLSDGTLSIKKDVNSSTFNANAYHTFKANKGSMLRVILPDETIVYLNSGTQIEIATSYGKNTRDVKLKGEAYFDVFHDKNVPFVVNAKNANIKVLGTTFNVSAYEQDKNVKTTLIDGSVALSTVQQDVKITPGQQAVVTSNAAIRMVSNVDLSEVLAWKEGYFSFKDQSIVSILQDMAKWYDIKDVELDSDILETFTGKLKRTAKLEDVLNGIEKISSLRFEIKEGRVKVMK